MANKALLFWCAGSALICGTAALATNTLWRAPTAPVGIATQTDGSLPDPAAPPVVSVPLAETVAPDPADTFLPLASVSFFEERLVASSVFRGTIEAAPSPVETAALEFAPPTSPSDFTEVQPEEPAAHRAVDALPPPRPRFDLARLDAARAAIGEVQPGQPAPGFETPAPQSGPGWNWGEAFRSQRPSGPERVINAGVASWYGPGFHGRKTASGERFDQNDMTAAHRTLPFGTRVKVVDEKSGRSIVVRINDRGPFSHGRVIDLSKQAAQALGMGGLARVKIVSAN